MDVGGTNTDAALIEGASQAVIGAAKAPTTRDPFRGITKAVRLCLKAAQVGMLAGPLQWAIAHIFST